MYEYNRRLPLPFILLILDFLFFFFFFLYLLFEIISNGDFADKIYTNGASSPR